ncbi:MAG: hypothetical protein JNJ63_12925 [Hyphomonadaceae bacterium]|nr:hypothetical protein [Hyphomonadaceae bacterium]
MSAVRTLVFAALASVSFAGSAFAGDTVFTAKLESPLAAPARVITLNTVWNCEGDTCRARPNHASTVRACRQFAHEVGARVVAYGPEGAQLSADEIARCNGETQQARN